MRRQELVWKSESLHLINSRCPLTRVGEAQIILSWVFVIQMYSTQRDTCSATWVSTTLPCAISPQHQGESFYSLKHPRMGQTFSGEPIHAFMLKQSVTSSLTVWEQLVQQYTTGQKAMNPLWR